MEHGAKSPAQLANPERETPPLAASPAKRAGLNERQKHTRSKNILLKNYTPHPIVIEKSNGESLTFSSDGIARCVEEVEAVGITAERIPVVRKSYGAVSGLPEPEPGVMLIVSAIVRLALPTRKDLLSPGDAVRDEQGRIVAVKNLVCNY